MGTEVSEKPAPQERKIAREKMDEVVIRFAGDSGDGMQLTGGQFTATSALLGNDLATLPDYPGRNSGTRGLAARGLGLPGQDRRLRHPHPRRRARRLDRYEPGGAQEVAGRSEGERHHHRQRRRVQRSQSEEGRLRQQSPGGRQPRGFSGLFRRHHHHDPANARGQRTRRQDPGSVQELLCPGDGVLALQPAARGHFGVVAAEVQGSSRDRRRQHQGAQGGVQLL